MDGERDADGLTEGQRRFVVEYAAVPNASRAYRLAHPHVTPATAATEGSRTLKIPKVRDAIAAARAEYAESAKVSAVQVLAALAAIGFLDPIDLYAPGPDGLPRPRPLADLPPDVRRALQAVRVRGRGDTATVEYVPADKLAALRLLAEHLGLLDGGPAVRGLLERLTSSAAEDTGPAGRLTPRLT